MPSLRSRIFRLFFRLRRVPLRSVDTPLAATRHGLDRLGALTPLPPGVNFGRALLDCVPGEWITPLDARPGAVLMYLHGGGYSVGSCVSHRALVAHLALAGRVRAFSVEYRLAPEHLFPAALDDACQAYRGLLANGLAPEKIILAGDSAGGGLAAATLVALRDAGDPLPAGAVLLSPWTDLAGAGASLQTRARRDPWLKPQGIRPAAALYLGETAPDHPLASPLYADLHGLPPLLIHVGDDEILLDDSTRLAAKAQAAGVDVTLKIWPGMWHVFHAFLRYAPEARQAIDEIGAWVQQQLDQPGRA